LAYYITLSLDADSKLH